MNSVAMVDIGRVRMVVRHRRVRVLMDVRLAAHARRMGVSVVQVVVRMGVFVRQRLMQMAMPVALREV